MRDLDERVFQFSCRIVDVFNRLHERGAARALSYQLLNSGTSIGANYQEAAAGQTKADFIAKLSVARKECRETLYWLQLIGAKHLLDPKEIVQDISEARQLRRS